MEITKSVVLVTGSQGMVGRNLMSLVERTVAGQFNEPLAENAWLEELLKNEVPRLQFVFADRSSADLTDLKETIKFFESIKPKYVVHLAAKVGGLFANMDDKVAFFEQNMLINANVIKASK